VATGVHCRTGAKILCLVLEIMNLFPCLAINDLFLFIFILVSKDSDKIWPFCENGSAL
jgi:hypothetical protein